MRSLQKLWRDNRGIEGLPIRLVIALVVGVSALAIMTSILGGLPTFDSTEVTVEVGDGSQPTVTDVRTSTGTLTFNVVTDKGEPVKGAQIVIEGGTVSTENGATVASTGEDSNSVDVTFTDEDNGGSSGGGGGSSFTGAGSSGPVVTDLREDQNTGTLKISIQPPSDSNYVDKQDNPEVLVTA